MIAKPAWCKTPCTSPDKLCTSATTTRNSLVGNTLLSYGESYKDEKKDELDLAGKLALILVNADQLRIVSVEWESNGRKKYQPNQTWRKNSDLTIPKKCENHIPETGVMFDCTYSRIR